MARKPANFQWLGFTEDQRGDLDFLDYIGNNGWARNSQTEAIMPKFIVELEESIGLERVKQCMAEIGYGRHALRMLDRWYSKGTTGKFGR
ncbi:MAG: hypothetical protein ACOYX5_16000 [Actinomycetota bacterium]